MTYKTDFSKRILFTNEPTKCTNELVSPQNILHWTFENPYYIINKISPRYQNVNKLCFWKHLLYHCWTLQSQNCVVTNFDYRTAVLSFRLGQRIFRLSICWKDRSVCPNPLPSQSTDVESLNVFLGSALKQIIYSNDIGHDGGVLKESYVEMQSLNFVVKIVIQVLFMNRNTFVTYKCSDQ